MDRVRVGLVLGSLMFLSVAGPWPVAAQEQGATPATAECPATTPEENLTVVERFFEGVNTADLTLFDDVVAPDVIYHGATVSDESGLETLKRTYGEALTGFPGVQYRLLTATADDDAVAVRMQAEGIHTGDFRGLEPTGNTVIWTHSAFAHVECGQIVEMWAEIDQLDRLKQFDLLVSEGPAARMAGETATVATPIPATSAESCEPLTAEELIAVADRVRAEVYGNGDFELMPELFAEGYVHGSANGPDAVGIEQGAGRIGTFVTAFPDLEWTFDEVIAEGNRVSARWTTRGTHDGDLAGFAPTGTPVEFTGISHFTFDCGKIIEFQTEMDAAGMLEQVGAPVRVES
jgi:steroid delta-isomerase-like uncharacterized protein